MLLPGQQASLALAEIPCLSGTKALLECGVRSTMHAANLRSGLVSLASSELAESGAVRVLFDPQTSGGLLIAIAPDRASDLLKGLRGAGYAEAQIIGEICDRQDDRGAAVVFT